MLAVLTIAIAAQLDPGSLVPLYREALSAKEQRYGPEHPKVARSASDLGLYLRNIGDRKSAAEYLSKALAIDSKTRPLSDPVVARDLENLASVVSPEQAIELHRKAAECTDPGVSARNWAKFGDLSAARGDHEAAVQAYRSALAEEEASSGPEHPRVAVRLNDLAQALDPKSAEPLIRRALAIETSALGGGNPAVAITMNNLAHALLDLRQLAEAEALARQSMKILESALGPSHPRIAIAASNLGAILREKPDLAGARRAYSRALSIDENTSDLQSLAEVYQALGDKAKAKQLLDRLRTR